MLTKEIKREMNVLINGAKDEQQFNRWRAYEYCKRNISLDFTPKDYEEALKYISEKLGL